MNILWIPIFCPFPIDCGGKVATAHRIEYVAKHNNIYMVTEDNEPSDETNKTLEKLFKQSIIIKPPQRSIMNSVHWLIKASLNVGRHYNPEITKIIQDIILHEKIDVIIIDHPQMAVVLESTWDQIKGIPVIINQHNIEFDNVRSKLKSKGIGLFTKLYSLIESYQLYNWEKKLYRHSEIKAFTFVTKDDMALFQEKFRDAAKKKKLYYSPVGTDFIPIEKTHISHKGKAIVFTAAFDYYPNVHGALWFLEKVYPLIIQKIPDAKIYLVGRNPVEQIKKYRSENIIITDTVPTVIPYLQIADIFIIPIFVGGGVKMKLLEAGMFAKPIISSSFGIKGTIYKPGEDLITTDDPITFAESCINIINNPEEYKKMASNVRSKTEKYYDWNVVLETYEKDLIYIVEDK